ncbi:class D sortase [Alteribacter natronophilus]|uniref:class D sortase n=1 Tax=Alteribacter natronophilus TaxID=2583810 RepID=UPI00110EABC8|nr:class D sortase [Alteribacter natronophilus]TMW71226.1 class D sortase [Alteribacter natronophilus]
MAKEQRKRMKRFILLSFSMALIAGGLWFTTTTSYTFLKGYMLYKSGGGVTVQAEGAGTEDAHLQEEPAKEDVPGLEEDPDAGPLYPERPEIGDVIGELYIPKLDAKLPIYHGTDEDELAKGVGHFAGSVLPGEPDNAVLAGHRDTVFRDLGEIGLNDLLIVTTAAGEFEYKVKNVRIVDEDDRTVIVPKPRATLTVSTCYPFTVAGSAPERYVLVAELRGGERERGKR